MKSSVVIQSRAGNSILTFSQFSRDADGRERCVVSISGASFQGTTPFTFHPGESSLTEFFRTVEESPAVYRTDRYWGDEQRAVHFCLGQHDDEHIALTAYLRGESPQWRLEAMLVLRPEEVVRLGGELSELFTYGA